MDRDYWRYFGPTVTLRFRRTMQIEKRIRKIPTLQTPVLGRDWGFIQVPPVIFFYAVTRPHCEYKYASVLHLR